MRHLIIALVVAMSIVPWWWKFPGSNSCSCNDSNSCSCQCNNRSYCIGKNSTGRPRSPRSPSKPLEPSKPPEPPEPSSRPHRALLGAAQSSTNCFHRCPIVRARYVCEYKLCIDDGEDVWPILRPLWVAGNRSFPVKNDLLTPGRDRCPGYNKHLAISIFDDNEKPLWHAAVFENNEFFVRYCTPPCAEVWPP